MSFRMGWLRVGAFASCEHLPKHKVKYASLTDQDLKDCRAFLIGNVGSNPEEFEQKIPMLENLESYSIIKELLLWANEAVK